MKKNYVIDTNVLIHDPDCIYKFEDNNVYIPIYVIEEVDNFKKESSERGRNARRVIRIIDGMLSSNDRLENVSINDGQLFLYVPDFLNFDTKVAVDSNKYDYRILQTAIEIKQKSDLKTIMVSMDANLRVRAQAMKLPSQNYKNNSVSVNSIKKDYEIHYVDDNTIDLLYSKQTVNIPSLQLKNNEYVKLISSENGSKTVLCRNLPGGQLSRIQTSSEICGIKPLNMEQHFALDALLDPAVNFVTLIGKAGTGKTLLALAAAFQGVKRKQYTSILVARPVIPMGKDIGYIPGDINEKMQPWMQPIYDNIDILSMNDNEDYNLYFNDGTIKIEPLTYIRGRSIPNQYMIIDESQNLTPHEVKTILTRAGDGTKIVLTGDPNQIDNPYMDSTSNGLSVTMKKFLGNEIFASVVLHKSERSKLADIAASIL